MRTPLYNTGYWSMYDQYGESNLNYHELLTEFLQHLCERTRKGPPLTTAPRPRRRATPATPTTPRRRPRRRQRAVGGSGAQPCERHARARCTRSAASTHAATQIAGDQIYCTTAKHFTPTSTRRR